MCSMWQINLKDTAAILLISVLSCHSDQRDYSTWSEYLGGPDRNHYSSLTQITPQNVNQLKVAWSYAAPDSGQMQMNPIVIDGVLYGMTAAVQAFALDAATGKELWRFGDPVKAWHSTSRGVAYWAQGADQRILCTIGPWLYALAGRTSTTLTAEFPYILIILPPQLCSQAVSLIRCGAS